MRGTPDTEQATTFSLVQDPLLRLQRALRLAPRAGFGAPRRAILLALVTWLPIMVWAVATGRLQPGSGPENLLRHFGVHVRCLLALPLLVMSEPFADRIVGFITANFLQSGLVRPEDRSRFDAVIRSVERWRDSWVVWLALAGLVVLTTVTGDLRVKDADVLSWAQTPEGRGFGGSWFLVVVRPLFLLLLIAWLWRLLLTALLFRRIAALELQLVPSHPDRAGGLGFIEQFPAAFSLVVLALSSVVSAHLGHQVLAHGVHVTQLKGPMAGLAVLLAVIFLSPLLAFSGPLRGVRRRGRFEYGTLAGRHARGVHARWVQGRPVADEAILAAPELGAAADVATLYDLGTRIRSFPIGKTSLMAVLVPALLPMLVVVSLEVPLKEILLKILGAIA